MKFTNASAVEQVVWQMLLADYPRARNRSRINDLANGVPPWTDQEVEANHIGTNVNHLDLTKIGHDARSQFDNAFMAPDPLFTVSLDYGPAHKRNEWSNEITRIINRPIKDSAEYSELQACVFASTVLHGIAPAPWEDEERWLPDPVGVEDVLVPANTLRSLKNLPFFAIYRRYTGMQLYRMTHRPQVDPAWNMPLVEKALAWVDEQARTLNSTNWPEVWFPEKLGERLKSDGGLYASDAVPTVDCWDFYFWQDEDKSEGWRRRIILDAWGQPGIGGGRLTADRKFDHGKGDFLYNPGDRKIADKLSHIIHFQFGDASAVAPFHYHTVRSLGFLLYAVCHLQNRLRCKFSDAVFENMLQYFRVSNPADMDRLTKIDLVDKGILPEGLQFVRAEERWAVNQPLVTEALQLNRQTMTDVSSSFTQDLDIAGSERETATRTMAKANSTAALVGAILNRAYQREKFRYIEICRRFCIPNSNDSDVKKARVQLLRAGIPEEAINAERWHIEPTKVIGQGNKVLQVAIADRLMGVRPMLPPEGQKEVDRIYIAANSNNYDLANRLVPEAPHISDSMHDSELAFGTLMQGVPVTPKPGLNNQEVIETILRLIAVKIGGIMQSGGMGTPGDVIGLNLAAQYAGAFIEMLAQDKAEKDRVKQYGDALGKMMNEVKAMAQRQEEAAKQSQQGQGGLDPKDAAKIQATMLMGKTKADLAAKSHAQRTAQRQLQWEMEQKRKEAEHTMGMQHDLREHGAQLVKTGMETAQNLALQRAQATANADEGE